MSTQFWLINHYQRDRLSIPRVTKMHTIVIVLKVYMLLRSNQETRRKSPNINYNKLLKLYFGNWSQIIRAKLFSEMEKMYA